jgi:hypothetical protein
MYKTRITFDPRTQTLAGIAGEATPLPRAAEVVVLFNSVTAFGPKALHLMDSNYWFTYSIAPSTNTTGNSVTAQYSNDGGTTWLEFYASDTNEPVGDSTTFTDEIFIGPYMDVRVKFNNGAAAQASLFAVNMTLDARERGPHEA